MKTLVTEDGEDVVRRLQDVWYMQGRNGDNLICPFQCVLCHFQIIKKRDPFSSDLKVLPRDEDITVSHRIARSGRRGYATHATNLITDADIKQLARWREIEAAAGRAASLPGETKEGYSEINQMIKSLLRASRPL
jgi:hypothetical protein